MKLHFYIASLLVLGLLNSSCEKGEGEGGTSTIKGVVITEEWNSDFSIKRDEYPSQDLEVFIIYGNDDYYGDRIRTNYNGVYEFKYLREGNYTVFVYSKDPDIFDDGLNYDMTNRKMVVKQEVSITTKNQTVIVDTMRVIR
jgi:hypothetical protein